MRKDLELASPVAAKVQFLNILADELSASRTVEGFGDPESVRIENRVVDAGVAVPDGTKVLNVIMRFSLKVYPKDAEEGSDKPVVEISCRLVAIYFLPSMEGIGEENLIAFGRTSGIYSAWPYWRELVHSTSLRLSVPSIVLPTFRI
jgi:hypothetical protein